MASFLAHKILPAVIFSFLLFETRSLAADNGSRQTTIMPLGDSITAGGGRNPDGSKSSGYRMTLYTNLLCTGANVRMLGAYNPSDSGQDGYCPYLYDQGQNHNNGYPGYSSADILANLAAEKHPQFVNITNQGGFWLAGGGGTGRSALYPDYVLLMVGINDLAKRIHMGSPTIQGTLEGNVAGILNWFKMNRPQTLVFVGTLLPNARPAVNGQLVRYNQWLKCYVTNYGNCVLVDTYAEFVTNGVIKTGYLLGDGTHPTQTGYEVLGNAWAEALKPCIAQRRGQQ
jgi:lysophospholipase L1-like esterase